MEMRRTCKECGHPIDRLSKTNPFKLCGECQRGRRRVKVRKSFTCADCGGTFEPPAHTGKPPERCDPCRATRRTLAGKDRQKAWRAANPERSRSNWNKYNQKRLGDPEYVQLRAERALTKYGLTPATFADLLESQGGVCAICKGDRNGPGARFHVDHDHVTNRVRGLLCGRCNTAIGLMQDSPEALNAAAAYLRR